MTGPARRPPLEVALAVVDAVAEEAQPAGRGRQVFPFNQIRVHFAAPSPRAKAYLEAACQGPPSLRERIVERLERDGCALTALAVAISFVKEARPDWAQPEFDVGYTRTEGVETSAPAARLELTVTQGTTGRASYTFTSSTVAIGRGGEVRDGRQRLIRVNDVAFAEGGGEINRSVSRRHARIVPDASSGAFRVYDDGSAQGTSVVRKGRGIPVPRGTKGVRLQTGDEIVLGGARVRVRIQEA
jgi:hypothetical protein